MKDKEQKINNKWIIEISGNKKYLEDIIKVFDTLNFKPRIYEEEDKFYLEGDIFSETDDFKEVIIKSKLFLTLMSVVLHFKTERGIEPLKILRIKEIKENPDNSKEEIIYNPDGLLESSSKISKNGNREIKIIDRAIIKNNVSLSKKIIRKNGEIEYDLNTIENIKSSLEEAKGNNETLDKINKYLKPFFENIVSYSNNFSNSPTSKDILNAESKYGKDFELAKWTAMRNIFESISNDLGGRKEIYKMIGEDFAENFYRTACYYYTHPKNKPKNKDSDKNRPPERKMPLSEAEEVISTLLSKYIEYKVKNTELNYNLN